MIVTQEKYCYKRKHTPVYNFLLNAILQIVFRLRVHVNKNMKVCITIFLYTVHIDFMFFFLLNINPFLERLCFIQ